MLLGIQRTQGEQTTATIWEKTSGEKCKTEPEKFIGIHENKEIHLPKVNQLHNESQCSRK